MNRLFLTFSLYFIGACGQCPHEGDLPRWSDVATWDTGRLPNDGEHLTIQKPILLDIETNRVGGITLYDGGRLVFSPDEDHKVKLTAQYIRILDNSALEIGSNACRYTAEAEIMLWGNRSDDLNIEKFGQKFIGVDEGGSLEIHGPEKLSWTRLAKTLEPRPKSFFAEYEFGFKYFNLFEFKKSDGSLVQEMRELLTAEDIQNALDTVSSGSVVWIFKWGSFSKKNFLEDMASIATIFENYLGAEEGSSDLRKLQQREDVYSLLVDTDDMSHLQSYDVWEGKGDANDGVTTAELNMKTGGQTYRVSLFNRHGVKGVTNKVNIEVLPEDWKEYSIELQDDVSDWNVGDEIVIASTDYDHRQAERFEIKAIDGNMVSFTGVVKHIHFSGEQEGVEMRAEVGMLSKNIRIFGEVQDSCYGDENLCEEAPFNGIDNFGGHTKALRGFKSYNIQGAEFYHMGQGAVLGSYPIHYHMCHDTDEVTNPIVKNNAIHDTFSRCVTIHGSHGIHVIDNVAYNHFGHCFFLEDGGEKRTLFDHNLGLGTKPGILTLTDVKPTTFWITSPLNTLLNNVAAGSDYDEGHGFWYLFPDAPVGPSTDLFFAHREAKRTPILECSGNVAHSNGMMGLGFFNRLGKAHDFIGCSTYAPRVNATDKNSEFQPIYVEDFTAYKNRRMHIKMRSTAAELVNLKLADSATGVTLIRSMLGGYQRIRDSVIIGESINKGEPFDHVSYQDENGDRHKLYDIDRSVPFKNSYETPLVGVEISAEGPSHIHNVKFFNFRHNDYRMASAIMWEDAYPFNNGITSSIKQLTFDYSEPDEGLYVYNPSKKRDRGDDSIALRDLDGSVVSGGGMLMAPDTYITEKEGCEYNSDWNLDVCEVNSFAEFYLWPSMEETWSSFVMDEDLNIYAKSGAVNSRIAYTLREGQQMILNFNTTMPHTPLIRMAGMQQNEEIIIGFCLPMKVIEWESCLENLVEMDVKTEEAETKEDFYNRDDKNAFLDREKGVIYRKFTETRERSDDELGECIGGLHFDNCPYMSIKLHRIPDMDFNSGADCRERF